MNAASSPARSASRSVELSAVVCRKPDPEGDKHRAENGVERAPNRGAPQDVPGLRNGEGVGGEPPKRHRAEEQAEPEQGDERVAELRQQAREEDGHLRVAKIADHTLAKRGMTAARAALRR